MSSAVTPTIAAAKADGTVLVCGGTGQQGSAVARHLLAAGRPIRVLTRDPARAVDLEALGAHVVAGDLLERASVDAALRGVRQVFLVTTRKGAGLEAEVRQGVTMADAARAAGVEHLVYTSVGCADRRTGVPHFDTKYEVEQHILGLGLPHTFLRPVFFMENFACPWFLPALRRGKLVLPLPPGRPIQVVAVDDIGRFAAAAFLEPQRFVGRAVGLAGDELSFAEAMRRLSGLTGRQVTYEQLPPHEVEASFGREWAVMFRWFDEVGYAVDVEALRGEWGIPVTGFDRWARNGSWDALAVGNTAAACESLRQ